MTTPLQTVVRSALLIGVPAFVIGFVGPALLSNSNLGPLFGIVFSGPIGVIAGALWGVLRAARQSDASQMRALTLTLCGIWALTLIYTLLMVSLPPRLSLAVIALQLMTLVATAVFLYRTAISSRLPEPVRRSRPIILAVMTFILATTLFPPVIRAWWRGNPQNAAVSPIPRVAFLLDGRLSSAGRMPLLAIHKRALLLEWAIAAAIAIGAGFVATKAGGRRLAAQ